MRPCRRDCQWKPFRGGKYERCTVCGDYYPCHKKCRHLDCASDRIERGLGTAHDMEVIGSWKARWPFKGLPVVEPKEPVDESPVPPRPESDPDHRDDSRDVPG